MTTLTRWTPHHSNHCAHKLPTSCLLTGLPTCCACQDKRPHVAVYPKYIDGEGLVIRRTRQDGYCPSCKVFWNVRTAAANITPDQARIPHIPDQHDFVNTWHDWHRRYRSFFQETDGSESIEFLHGQALNEVLIGHLPVPSPGIALHDSRAVKWIPPPPVLADVSSSKRQEVMTIADEDKLFDSEEDEEEEKLQEKYEWKTDEQNSLLVEKGGFAIEPLPELSITGRPQPTRFLHLMVLILLLMVLMLFGLICGGEAFCFWLA